MSKRARNPSSSSSSGNRYLNHSEFRSLLSKRPVLIERQLTLSDFPMIQLLFEQLGWESLTTISASVPVKLVQEFYANFHETDFENAVFKTSVDRVHIHVTPDLIASVLGIERPSLTERMSLFYPTQDGVSPSKEELTSVFSIIMGSPPWKGETYVHGHLKTDHRMLNLFVSASIDPTSHYSDVTLRRGRVIYAIVMGLKFDIALFIFRLMFTAQQLKRTKDSLPFGVLVTNILKYHNVELPSSSLLRQPPSITRLTARKSVSQAVDDTLDHPDAAESSRSTRPFTMNSMSLSLLRLEGEVENVRTVQIAFGERLSNIESSIHNLTELCTANFQSLHQQIDNLGYELRAEDDDDDDTCFGGGPFSGGDGAGGSGFGGGGGDGHFF